MIRASIGDNRKKRTGFDMTSLEEPKRRQDSAVRIHDVARLANVALITVSRALNDPDRVSEKTLKRVMDAVAKTRYVPNLAARGLKSSKTRLIAALMPTLSGPFGQMVEALSNACASKGYQVVLGQIGYSAPKEEALLRAIVGRRPDGIIIAGVNHSPATRNLLSASGIPIVEVWDITPTPIDMLVSFSQEKLSDEVCRFLVKRGHRHLAIIGGDDERSARRTEVFLKTAQSLGLDLPAVEIAPAPTNHATGRAALAALLARHPSMDAVFCSSDMVAMGVLTEAQVRGVAVPHALAVVGAGDSDFAATLNPSLTTVRLDAALIGTTAVQFIIDRVEGQQMEHKVAYLGFSIVQRESA
jgi:LacI family gluconate utilization system Gnt-I transcriptional repressor